MGILIRGEGKYNNKNAVHNVIKYVTRTRENEERLNELYGYGGRGIDASNPNNMIMQMEMVQQIYDIQRRKGRRVYHEYFWLDKEQFEKMGYSYDVVNEFALACCGYYYNKGYQEVYAIHETPDKNIHIHFVVNSINFENGRKFHDSKAELECRNQIYNEMADEFSVNHPIFNRSMEFMSRPFQVLCKLKKPI